MPGWSTVPKEIVSGETAGSDPAGLAGCRGSSEFTRTGVGGHGGVLNREVSGPGL